MQISIPSILTLPPCGNKTGWPWMEVTTMLPPSMPDDFTWPRISIVTPSYNQVQFIEQTIRSVLLQGYPNLEYIIIDGGSTDGSVEIIKKYESWLAYWVSEKDRGQSHAINKGFARSTGEIMAWINSDDYYMPGAFTKVVEIFSHQETMWLAGKCYQINVDGIIKPGYGRPLEEMENWFHGNLYAQPAVFWRRALWEKTKGVDESLQYSFDYDLWMKFSQTQLFAFWTDQELAFFRIHSQSKTFTSLLIFDKEDWAIFQRYKHRINNYPKWFVLWWRRREQTANRYLFISDTSQSPGRKILLGIAFAPWYLFRRKFYSKAKNILFPKKK